MSSFASMGCSIWFHYPYKVYGYVRWLYCYPSTRHFEIAKALEMTTKSASPYFQRTLPPNLSTEMQTEMVLAMELQQTLRIMRIKTMGTRLTLTTMMFIPSDATKPKNESRSDWRLTATGGHMWKAFRYCAPDIGNAIVLRFANPFKIFIPHVWPVHDKAMQLRAVAVGACLLTGNFLNIMIPRQLGMVTDALVKGKSPTPNPRYS